MHAPAPAVRVSPRMMRVLSCDEVAALLADRSAELALELLGTGPTSRTGFEWRFRRKGSLGVHVAGPKRGRFYDNEAWAYGDALDLVAHLRSCSVREAYRWALRWLSVGTGQEHLQTLRRPKLPSNQPQQPLEPDPANASRALHLWDDARPAIGSPVERYLVRRGLELPANSPLRFHPACPRGRERLPTMLAQMTDPATCKPCGVHRTFLLPDGSGKALGQAKMMLGPAGVVRLVPDAEVTLGLGIAEGIETALAVMQRYGWAPVWAAGSAGGIARFPVLPAIAALTVFPDADDGGASLAAAVRCAQRWQAAGREVRFFAPPSRTDFADLAKKAVS